MIGASDDPAVRGTRVQLDFLVEVHQLERIVLITHFACAWYGHLLNKPPDECVAEQMRDVRSAAATLAYWYPGMTIDGYLAMRQNDWLSFHAIDMAR